MVFLSTMTLTLIIVLSIVGVALLVGAFILIEKLIIKKANSKKILNEVEKKYEYNHSLLLGQDAQYIQRLEIISRSNLLYSDIHATYFRQFKEIRDNQDAQYLEILNELKDKFFQKDYKGLKQYYRDNVDVLNGFEESVKSFSNKLYDIIKPEEEARQQILKYKDEFRKVKSEFNSYENDLVFVYDSFQKVFENIENKFYDYEAAVETANYDEAKAMIPEIEKILEVLGVLITEIPKLIKEVNIYLPDEIDELVKEYNEMVQEGYPLASFRVEDTVSNIQFKIDEIKERLKGLRINGIRQEIDSIYNLINGYHESFKQEKDCKVIFENEYEAVNNNFLKLEKEFINISNAMVKIKKYYVIDPSHEEQFNELKDKLNEVSKDKRRLEIYVHSMEKTLFKDLVSKMEDLKRGNGEFNAKINNYLTYISSLKNDAENAYKLIATHYLKAKEYFSDLKQNYPKHYKVYADDFDKLFQMLDEINAILSVVPIDILKLNKTVNTLTELSSNLFKNVEEVKHLKRSARNLIITANRDRNKFADINSIIEQAEDLYKNGEYKQALDIVNNALNKIALKNGVN
ncbi:MAG: hypothetical protein IJ656_01830 [Bacilli bacterium]|nr:hypothetical protein [Bacilli bacterium]